MRFLQGPTPVGRLLEVIERSEQQRRIDRVVLQIYPAGVAGRNRGEPDPLPAGGGFGLLDVQGCGVAQMHGVPQRRQPHGVHAGAAANVRDGGRRRRKATGEHLPGALPLEQAVAGIQTVALLPPPVVLQDLPIRPRRLFAHAATLPQPAAGRNPTTGGSSC